MKQSGDSNMVGGYTEGEIALLHSHLYRILRDVVTVCEKLDVKYFLIGGSAIGAHFMGGILPWDDDIDIGMERADYERFVAEAQQHLPHDLFVQSPDSERYTPHYFTKIRLGNSRFEERFEAGLPMHHGVFVDIFPLDVVPQNRIVERLQRLATRICTNIYAAKSGGKYDKISARVLYGAMSLLTPRALLMWAMRRIPALCNASAVGQRGRYINIISQPRDHISRATVNPTQRVQFGDAVYSAPQDLEVYLNHHYPNLRVPLPREEWVNHYPLHLQLPKL